MNKYLKKLLFIILSLSLLGEARAQEAVFTPPFDFPIVFSGNFGEIRSNHFHGGLGMPYIS